VNSSVVGPLGHGIQELAHNLPMEILVRTSKKWLDYWIQAKEIVQVRAMNYFAECEEGACDDCNFDLLDLDLWSSQVHRHQANDNTKNKYSLKFMTSKAKFELWIMQLQRFIMMNPSWRGMKLFLKNINTTTTNHRELVLSITSSCFFTQYSHIEIRENGNKKRKHQLQDWNREGRGKNPKTI
jgi:hypothetical protein